MARDKLEPIVIDGVEFRFITDCPCGQPVYANTDEEFCGMIHGAPMCPKFDELDPPEFATYLRVSKLGMMDLTGLQDKN